MKKYFDKLDKKFKLNERLGIAYDNHGASSGQNPQGFSAAASPQQPQHQQPQQQQYGHQQHQQHQQQHQQHQQHQQQHQQHQQHQYQPPPPPPPPQVHAASPPHAQFPPPPPGPPPPQSQPQPQTQAHTQAPRMGPPTAPEINRYRTHHGTNIGSVFVLERWLFPGMFLDSAKGGSELSAVSAWVEAHGIESARSKWEEHWASAMAPADWAFLRDTARITSVRLPIGWFTLGPHYCGGTVFEPFAAVYENAWLWVRRYVQAAAEHGIGVLLDLHALPGGANSDEHSGTDSMKSEFWESDQFRQRATEVLVGISRAIVQDPIMKVWVLGLQLVNEAITGAGDRGMWSWYDSTLAAVAAVDSTLPVYLSDAWDSVPALDYAVGKNNARLRNPLISPPLVIDIHKYYCFDAYNKKRSPPDIIAAIAEEGSDIASYHDKEVGTVIGEYSCVLDNESWSKVTQEQRPDLVRQFGIAQSLRWEQTLKPVNGGAYFWTAKMAWMEGGEWGFVEQSRKGNIVPPVGLTLSEQRVTEIAAKAKAGQTRARDQAIEEHVQYWDQHSPGQQMEHWRFAAGYDVGFWDALTFWESARKGATIGFVNLWVGKRLGEHVADRGGFGSQFQWEFEHGVKRGLKDMESFIN